MNSDLKKILRESKQEDTLVKINDNVIFGLNKPVIIAGPCSVESEDQIYEIAKNLKQIGADMLRGGTFKPRTSPYSFQGMGLEGLKLLNKVGKEFDLPIISECVSIRDVENFAKYSDMIQIGARNMQNFDLIIEIAKTGKPILLKRGLSATLEEFLFAGEYVLSYGNNNLVLCERGIRTFETSSRNILDLNTLAIIKNISHIPIIADPSHSGGRRDIIIPLSKSALACGANGLIIEVHNDPDKALSDGKQSLDIEMFKKLMSEIKK